MRDALGRVQSVAIFGAGSDIARATLLALLKDGPLMAVLCARAPDRLEVGALEAEGAAIEVHPFDAMVLESHPALVDEVFRQGRDIDLVLLTSGLLGDEHESQSDAAAACRMVQTNFTGPVSVLTPVVERMLAQGHGTIVVLSSFAAVRARRANAVYGASKAGLDAFCQGIQLRLQGTGVKLMIVRPGFVRTKMTAGLRAQPLAIEPDRVAACILAGLQSGKDVVWAPPVMRLAAAVIRLLPRRIAGSL